ncbi:unnamed protein product [Sphagnum jensenii]
MDRDYSPNGYDSFLETVKAAPELIFMTLFIALVKPTSAQSEDFSHYERRSPHLNELRSRRQYHESVSAQPPPGAVRHRSQEQSAP